MRGLAGRGGLPETLFPDKVLCFARPSTTAALTGRAMLADKLPFELECDELVSMLGLRTGVSDVAAPAVDTAEYAGTMLLLTLRTFARSDFPRGAGASSETRGGEAERMMGEDASSEYTELPRLVDLLASCPLPLGLRPVPERSGT